MLWLVRFGPNGSHNADRALHPESSDSVGINMHAACCIGNLFRGSLLPRPLDETIVQSEGGTYRKESFE